MALSSNFKNAFSSNFKNAFSFCLKDTPDRKNFFAGLAQTTATISGCFFVAYKIGVGDARKNGEITCPDGYPSWKESSIRKKIIELIRGSAKN